MRSKKLAEAGGGGVSAVGRGWILFMFLVSPESLELESECLVYISKSHCL